MPTLPFASIVARTVLLVANCNAELDLEPSIDAKAREFPQFCASAFTSYPSSVIELAPFVSDNQLRFGEGDVILMCEFVPFTVKPAKVGLALMRMS